MRFVFLFHTLGTRVRRLRVHRSDRPGCQGGSQGCGKHPQRPSVAIPSTLPGIKDRLDGSQIRFVFTNACQSPASTDASRQDCAQTQNQTSSPSRGTTAARKTGEKTDTDLQHRLEMIIALALSSLRGFCSFP